MPQTATTWTLSHHLTKNECETNATKRLTPKSGGASQIECDHLASKLESIYLSLVLDHSSLRFRVSKDPQKATGVLQCYSKSYGDQAVENPRLCHLRDIGLHEYVSPIFSMHNPLLANSLVPVGFWIELPVGDIVTDSDVQELNASVLQPSVFCDGHFRASPPQSKSESLRSSLMLVSDAQKYVASEIHLKFSGNLERYWFEVQPLHDESAMLSSTNAIVQASFKHRIESKHVKGILFPNAVSADVSVTRSIVNDTEAHRLNTLFNSAKFYDYDLGEDPIESFLCESRRLYTAVISTGSLPY